MTATTSIASTDIAFGTTASASSTRGRLDARVGWLIDRISPNSFVDGGDDDEWRVVIDGHRYSGPSRNGLTSALSSRLYSHYHAGIIPDHESSFLPALLEDPEMESRLIEATTNRQRVERLRLLETDPVHDSTPHRGVIVSLQGVRVFFASDRVVGVDGSAVHVTLPTLESRLSPGFLFYTSTHGAGLTSRLLRVYRHIGSADEAVSVWRRLTTWVEANGVPLRMKITSRAGSFPRNDALVMYLSAQCWDRLDEIIALLETDHPLSADPLFTKRVGRGVAVAWEPMDVTKPRSTVSFGEHRASLIARGIVAGAGARDATRRAVRAALITANVDPLAIHRNLDSPSDIR